jgi:hypothetical protein
MNRNSIFISTIARFGKIKYTSFKDRFTKEKLYAAEVEMIADFFGRPISYYFDQEEKEMRPYNTEKKLDLAKESKENDPPIDYDPKQRKIEELTNKLYSTKDQLEKLNKKYIRLLEKESDKKSGR